MGPGMRPDGTAQPGQKDEVFGLVLRPRATRLVASEFAALTAADFLQFAYVAAEKIESS